MPKYENKGAQAADPIPEGTYNFKVAEVETTAIKSGENVGNPALVIWFELLGDPEFAGRKLRSSFLIRDTKGEMPKWAMYGLFDVLSAVGDAEPFDTDQADFVDDIRARVEGKTLSITVQHRTVSDGRTFAEVARKGYKPAVPMQPLPLADEAHPAPSKASPAASAKAKVAAPAKEAHWDEDIPF